MKTHMADRIKLAEWMGAKRVDGIWHWKGSTWDSLLFDPFTDANDDYAVLEKMRSKPELILVIPAKFTEVVNSRLDDTNMWNYCLGDYARAALRVIDQSPNKEDTG